MAQHNRQARIGRSEAVRRQALGWSTMTGQHRHAKLSTATMRLRGACRGYAPVLLGGAALLVSACSTLFAPVWAANARSSAAQNKQELRRLPVLPRAGSSTAGTHWLALTVAPKQSLMALFRAQGLPVADAQQAIKVAGSSLLPLQPGQRLDLLLGPAAQPLAMRYDAKDGQRMMLLFEGQRASLNRLPQGPAGSHSPAPTAPGKQVAHGVIQGSLFAAGTQAGLSKSTTLALANIFKYDIDFSQDLHAGDRFRVLYQQDAGQQQQIIAAQFINQGHRFTAYRFKPTGGAESWYSEDGRPLQKSFLRIPVDFTRISSTFSAARRHPILGRMRAHKGVDYAAPSGTPIHAAGDGVVVFRGWQSGYGNFVIIQHNATISTAYGHMSRFGKERIGQHVQQGQVIGYVGMSGLATGPHLHYEFRVNGIQRNPQTITLPGAAPLPAAVLAQFRAQVVRPQLARLEGTASLPPQLAAITPSRSPASAAHD